MALKRGAGGGAGNLAIPFHSAGDGLGRFLRRRRDVSHAVDEILVRFEILRFKFNVERGIMRSEKPINGSVGRRGREFSAGRDQQRARIETVVELPSPTDRQMAFGKLIGIVPDGFCEDFEVAEGAGPGFDRIG